MANPAAYLETSVIGYVTSRPSRDLIVAAHQQLTRDWFDLRAADYELYVSQLVVRECSQGDAVAVQERLAFIEGFPMLSVTEASADLAKRLVDRRAVPPKAADDAIHIAMAAVHGTEFLVTWNCKHIANATMRAAIERVCREMGYEPPIICTPEELLNDDRQG